MAGEHRPAEGLTPQHARAVILVEGPSDQGALAHAGFGHHLTRGQMEQHGFYVCVEDLEEELIRAVGHDGMIEVIRQQRELLAFRSFQNMPAQRGRAVEAQLHRFMGTKSGRKIRYPRLLIGTLDLERVPRPLDAVLASV